MIEPFVISAHQTVLADLRSRLRRTRWPDRETVPGWPQGVPLDYLQSLCRSDSGWPVLPGQLADHRVERAVDGLEDGITAIAARLYLSEATVKGYVSRMLDKLGCANRTQAGLLAHEAGLTSR